MVHSLQQSRMAEKCILIESKDQVKYSFWKSELFQPVKVIQEVTTWKCIQVHFFAHHELIMMNTYTAKYFQSRKTSTTPNTELVNSKILFFLIHYLKKEVIILVSRTEKFKANQIEFMWLSSLSVFQSILFDIPNKSYLHNIRLGLCICLHK